jgi:hypothetical protein
LKLRRADFDGGDCNSGANSQQTIKSSDSLVMQDYEGESYFDEAERANFIKVISSFKYYRCVNQERQPSEKLTFYFSIHQKELFR